MNLQTLIANLSTQTSAPEDLEKTAERAFLDGLDAQESGEDRPLKDVSTDQLYAMIKSAEDSSVEAPEEVEADEDLEKVASDIFSGQVMAHAMVHEFKLIKVAVANGQCRVCKERPMDVEGSSICSACGE